MKATIDVSPGTMILGFSKWPSATIDDELNSKVNNHKRKQQKLYNFVDSSLDALKRKVNLTIGEKFYKNSMKIQWKFRCKSQIAKNSQNCHEWVSKQVSTLQLQ